MNNRYILGVRSYPKNNPQKKKYINLVYLQDGDKYTHMTEVDDSFDPFLFVENSEKNRMSTEKRKVSIETVGNPNESEKSETVGNPNESETVVNLNESKSLERREFKLADTGILTNFIKIASIFNSSTNPRLKNLSNKK